MPPTRYVSKQPPFQTSNSPRSRFTIPASNHLLITTPSAIYAWDSADIHVVFQSSKSGIIAAKEAKDGSGVLAIADKHVVVLHDPKRGQDRSWGLEADKDEVRHLEYTVDAKSLFLSTNLTSDIQRYSTEHSRLLSPTHTATSPPTALAISPTGHLLVSASNNPPVVYAKNLTHNSPPISIETQASETAVSTIAFHPERPNIFLLGFRDGTLAAFDATKMSSSRAGSLSNQERINAGELSHLTCLHRTTVEATNAPTIADAAFIPGYKTRAVTVGSDGRCRLVDFSEGGVVLRTWHAKAPATSVSILAQGYQPEARRSARSAASRTTGGPTSTNNLIAIGRTDGKVHIYDSVGLLLSQLAISEKGEKVISVEWAKGPSPNPIRSTVVPANANTPLSLAAEQVKARKRTTPTKPAPDVKPNPRVRRETTFEHVGLPPALRLPKANPDTASTGAPRRFTIHPDEIEEGTVRRGPVPQESKPHPVSKAEFLDLFSPVKRPLPTSQESPANPIGSTPRSRPKISPQTFAKHPEPVLSEGDDTVAEPRNLALFPSTDSSSNTPTGSKKVPQLITKHKVTHHVPSLAHNNRIVFKPVSQRHQRRSGNFRLSQADAASKHNAKVLADIRKMSAIHPAHRNKGVLSAFGTTKPDPTTNGIPSISRRSTSIFHRTTDDIETELDSENALKAYEDTHRRHNWPEDSNQDSSLDGDIWLTSDSDERTRRGQRRRKQPDGRPPARQTSRSRVDSTGTFSTYTQAPTALENERTKNTNGVDGSTDEAMLTAGTHISPSGTFSPSSNDVRKLFPRTSSLSPRKGRNGRRGLHRTSPAQGRNLREIAVNSVLQQQPKSPWERVKASRVDGKPAERSARKGIANQVEVWEDKDHGTVKSHAPALKAHCDICPSTMVKVRALEGEVVHLKGKVLALKAALRRNGVAIPIVAR